MLTALKTGFFSRSAMYRVFCYCYCEGALEDPLVLWAAPLTIRLFGEEDY